VAGLSLGSLAGAASASTTVTTTVNCSGVYSYSNTSTLTVNQLPPSLKLPYSTTYSFPVAGGTETCSINVS
jgi:hypothetical protein